ncbi:hypothetical protein [Rhizobium sp. BT03]|uniref:hypothetical protein n=1 Tax=Rhizobium sp. BT03 TaxID=3045156 RepID=UPI0024B3D0A5|nr:hypothetical protein [Rhizobium sp. BT03]WHO76263.1 hypothetical protein QMO80_005375 [Rhizobium sp. BT03]
MKDDYFIVQRRNLLKLSSLVLASAYFEGAPAIAKESSLRKFEAVLYEIASSNRLIEDNRGYREYAELPISGLEQVPLDAEPSDTRISDRASMMIVAFEVSSASVYKERYRHPVWPKGASGVTFGIGYDIGYASKEAFVRDWRKYLDASALESLAEACGVTGDEAKGIVGQFADVTVPWQVAKTQYLETMQPRYVGITERALPNFKMLSQDCRGALVSLVYNRGASFSISERRDKKSRFREMRNIRQAMSEKAFNRIPGEIRAMKRLWDPEALPGLHKRRDAEALLFEIGLG